MKKVTAKDVAARAGVSVSAVSRAYRGNAPIAEDKRKAIFAAATALGYVSKVDQVLAKQSSNTISMVLSEMRNPFYPIVMDELTRMLPGRGLKAIMHVVPAAEDVDTMIRQVIDFRTQGVILASSTITSGLARACRQNGIPAVLLNRGDTSTHLERMRGFRDQLEEAGREIAVQFDGGFSYRQAYAAAQEMLVQRPMPDAVFCANDIMAIAMLDAARNKGISVPGDLAVIGFDDIPMAAWESYRLTTMRQPLRRMLDQAVDIILSAESYVGTGDIRVLAGELQERQSG